MKALLLAAALPACLVSEDGGLDVLIDRVHASGETTFQACPADCAVFQAEMERQAACVAFRNCHRCYRFTTMTPFPIPGGGCGAAWAVAQYDLDEPCRRADAHPARPHDPDAGAAVAYAGMKHCAPKCRNLGNPQSLEFAPAR